MKEEEYMRVGTTLYKVVNQPCANGGYEKKRVVWNNSTLRQDYGKNYLATVPKYDGFCIVPNHLNYQKEIEGFLNLYDPIEHKPQQGEFSHIQSLMRHIFGEQYELGMDYMQLLYLQPTQKLPIVLLVSEERNTGKSTFLNFLKAVFENNVTFNTNEDFRSQFNSDWAGKLLIVVDEVLLNRREDSERLKNLSTTFTYKVEASQAKTPLKPVIDDEPIYEDIPQGLHDPNETRWNQHDVRRYAYWSVFAGSFGHSYGHNDIMQFIRPGYGASFGADGRKKAWWDALEDPGFNQMKYLKNLMLTFPFFERVPDQSVIAGTNGERYDRAIATRGNDYLLVYNYSGRPMQIDLSKISGAKKNAWWYSAKDGKLEYIGEFDSKVTSFQHDSGYLSGNDQVLIVVDSAKDYVQKAWTALPDAIQKWNK